jgi:hypothetical protein
MSEEAFSFTFVGLSGCSLGFLSTFVTAIVVAGGSWTSISAVYARFHLLSTFLFQELDQLALDLPRLWPCGLTSIGGAELGRRLQRSAGIG